jgi:uncharacterized protein (DUF885 family)
MTTLALACLDAPGPLHPRPGGSCFYLATGDASDRLRALNRPRVAFIAAHETYPGHHVQALHVRRAAHPLLAAAASEVFDEGWAHYAERLLVERGFRGGDPAIAVAVAMGRAVRLVRLVGALSIHAGRATVEGVAGLFRRYAFLAAGEAEREARRALGDPGVLAYTLGRDRILARRRAAERERGYTLARFHHDLLGRGTVPIDLQG